MDSKVIFQISTVLLALALAAVLAVMFTAPDEGGPVVEPKVNAGLMEIDDLDLADPSVGSFAKGKIYVVNDGEFRIRLMVDMTVGEDDWSGFRAAFRDGMVVDKIYCEFNGNEEEGSEYVWFNNSYHSRGVTQIVVDSSYVDATLKHGPGSGTLVADLKMDAKSIDDVDFVECYFGIGYSVSGEIYESAHKRLFIPTKDADREEKGSSCSQRLDEIDVRISDAIDPMAVRFEDPDMTFDLSPVLAVNEDYTFTFAPNLVIPAGQGKFRSLILDMGASSELKSMSATYTDFKSMDPEARVYGHKYYLPRGAETESGEFRFTDSLTVMLIKDVDKAKIRVSIDLEMAQDGYVNKFSASFDVVLSRSGIFYETVDYQLTEQMEKSPTYEQMLDFKKAAESGDVVCVRGDFTEISRLTMRAVYERGSVATAVLCHDGELYSKAFFSNDGLRDNLDSWAISILGGDGATSS